MKHDVGEGAKEQILNPHRKDPPRIWTKAFSQWGQCIDHYTTVQPNPACIKCSFLSQLKNK